LQSCARIEAVMRCVVESVGLLGPGLTSWVAGESILAGRQPYLNSPPQIPRLELLPPTERRLTGATVKYALAVGADALARSSRPARDIPTVFAASGGDGEVLHEICSTLATSERQVSPTRFHNSVHNAPAGYFSIAMGARVASTSLCAYDWTFAAALLEASVQVATLYESVLLIVGDVAYPEPLRTARLVQNSFACALLLGREGEPGLCKLEVGLEPGARPDSVVADPQLEKLRVDNPAARALPLLAAIARGQSIRLAFDYLQDSTLSVGVTALSGHGHQ